MLFHDQGEAVAKGRIDLVTVVSIGAGALFMYAGTKNISVLSAIDQMITGKAPSTAGSAGAGLGSVVGTGGQSGAPGGGNLINKPGSKGTYSRSQIISLWVMAGGSQSTANNAACHAEQESGGDPMALNINGPGPNCDAVGLYQLATPCGVGKGYSVPQLQDAITNTRITVRATNDGRDWSQWATPGC